MTHNEKSPPGSGLHSENKPWQAVFWFSSTWNQQATNMLKYSNVSTQKRVLYE